MQIFEKKPMQVKNYGIWMRYNSRTDPINMYKEYRDLTLTGAVAQMYMEIAARHRGRASGVQIMKTAQLDAGASIRKNTTQFHKSDIKFPLSHRVQRPQSKVCSRRTHRAALLLLGVSPAPTLLDPLLTVIVCPCSGTRPPSSRPQGRTRTSNNTM